MVASLEMRPHIQLVVGLSKILKGDPVSCFAFRRFRVISWIVCFGEDTKKSRQCCSDHCDDRETATADRTRLQEAADTGRMQQPFTPSRKSLPIKRTAALWLCSTIAAEVLSAAQTTLAQETASRTREPSADGKPKIEVIEVVTPTKSAVERPVDSASLLRSARTIFVRSHSVLVKGAVVEEKLQKRPEFQQFGLLITRDVEAADLILELRHDLFTKYVYTAIDTRTQTLVASGKLSSLGGTVADKVAKRFLKQVGQARATP